MSDQVSTTSRAPSLLQEIDGLATPLIRKDGAAASQDTRTTKADSLVEAIRSAHETLGDRDLSTTARAALIAQSDRLVDCLVEIETVS